MDRMKVLFYARVSTKNESQADSLDNQIALANSYLSRHPEYELVEKVDTYIEMESAKSDIRDKYSEMLKRLEKGDISFLMIKDLKRLNRSSELSSQIRNHAKAYGYKFIILSTGAILDPNTEGNRLLYGFESLMNEEYVYRQSEYARLAHRQKCEAKRLNRNNVTFGYRWNSESKSIEINDEEAEIVRSIFDLYVFQGMGMQEIRRYFAAKGLNRTTRTISRWLSDTSYIGIFNINKKGSELGVGAGQKNKVYERPKSEWIQVERPELQIVDKEIFELAQKIRKVKSKMDSEDYVLEKRRAGGYFRGSHLFASKVFCAECGYSMIRRYADRKKAKVMYVDSFKSKARSLMEGCENKDFRKVSEADLIKITTQSINLLIDENSNAVKEVEKVLEEIIQDDSDRKNKIKSLNGKKKKLDKEKEFILGKFLNATESLEEALNKKFNDIQQEIDRVNEEIASIEKYEENHIAITERMTDIRNALKVFTHISEEDLTREIVEIFIQKILVHKNGVIEIVMNSDYRLCSMMKIDRTIKNEKSSLISIDDVAVFNFKDYDYEQIEDALLGISTKNNACAVIEIAGFDYELYSKRDNDKPKRKMDVVVRMPIEFDGNEK